MSEGKVTSVAFFSCRYNTCMLLNKFLCLIEIKPLQLCPIGKEYKVLKVTQMSHLRFDQKKELIDIAIRRFGLSVRKQFFIEVIFHFPIVI